MKFSSLILIYFLIKFSTSVVEWHNNMYRNTDFGTGVATTFITRHQIGSAIGVDNLGQCFRECTKIKSCLAGDFVKIAGSLASQCILLRRMPTADDMLPVADKVTFWKSKKIKNSNPHC
jgi:hypothetical protein